MEVGLRINPSYLWKSLTWGRDLLKMGMRYRIGNGETIKVFKEPWIPRASTFKPIAVNVDLLEVKAAYFIVRKGGGTLIN